MVNPRTTSYTHEAIAELLSEVTDPEIPVLTISDLGILREITLTGNGAVEVTITPTYSGCPAMDTIADDICKVLHEAGFTPAIKQQISPAWTTDWMSEAGKNKLQAYGIAPPVGVSSDKAALSGKKKQVPCPRCKSTHTTLLSLFGSTACKSLYRCEQCLETFDYFKCL